MNTTDILDDKAMTAEIELEIEELEEVIAPASLAGSNETHTINPT